MTELLCLCCHTSTEQVPDMRACPSCGCSKHPPADLGDTVTITLTQHELRVLTFWAAEHGRKVMSGPCNPIQTITDRLSLQTSTALSFSQEIADLRAAFPASDVTVVRDGRVADE